MNSLLNLLLRASITVSLSDREAFIDQVAQIIENKIGKDPDSARNIGSRIAAAMDGLNEQLLIEQLLRPEEDNVLHRKIDRLSETVERLTQTVERLVKEQKT